MNNWLKVAIVWLVFLPLTLIFGGFCYSVLWQWFVVPLGAPAIDVSQAIGLQLAVTWFMIGIARRKDPDTDGDDIDAWWTAFIYEITARTIFFGIGFAVHLLQGPP